jgi:hypothetical protein
MTGLLREALRAEAERAPAYPVYERALRTARRRWRRRLVAVAAACAVVGVLVVSGLPARAVHGMLTTRPAAGAGPSLPDRLGTPPAFYPEVFWAPAGPASVVFGGRDWPGATGDGDLAVVGATVDNYRTWRVGVEQRAGEIVLLSPDGRWLAYPALGDAGHPLRGPNLVDLRTGQTTGPLAPKPYATEIFPLAWAPDGGSLVVRTAEPGTTTQAVGVIDLGTGGFTRLALFGSDNAVRDGFAAAFTRDGQRLAFQVGEWVTVVGRADGQIQHQFRLPEGEQLAGKGAWTPDGTALTTVRDHGGRWTLTLRDPATGGIRQADRWTAPAGLAGLRLMGWDPTGAPVVVAYHPGAGAPDPPSSSYALTGYGDVHSVGVLALSPGGGRPRTVVAASPAVRSIDVADTVLATGRTRPGHPPRFGPLTPVGVVLLVAAAWVLVFFWRRRTGRIGKVR